MDKTKEEFKPICPVWLLFIVYIYIYIYLFIFIDPGKVETTWSRGSIAITDLIYLNKYTPKALGDTKTSNKRA